MAATLYALESLNWYLSEHETYVDWATDGKDYCSAKAYGLPFPDSNLELQSFTVNGQDAYTLAEARIVITKPPYPAWWYTGLRGVLNELGAPRDSITRWGQGMIDTPPPNSPVVAIRQLPLNYARSENAQINPIYFNGLMVGIISVSKDLWKVHLDTNLSLELPYTLTHPSTTDFAAEIRSARIAKIKETTRAIETHEDTIKRLKATLEDISRPVQTGITDPRVERIERGDDTIIVWTKPLVCRVEAETFDLGPTMLLIGANRWNFVITIASSPRLISHPHMCADGVCLGFLFSNTAAELQTKGYFGLYLTLLLDHLENGVDPMDTAGRRVFTLPKIKSEVPAPAVVEEVPELSPELRHEDEYNEREYYYDDELEEDIWEEDVTLPTPPSTTNATSIPIPAPASHQWARIMRDPAGTEFVLVGNQWVERGAGT